MNPLMIPGTMKQESNTGWQIKVYPDVNGVLL